MWDTSKLYSGSYDSLVRCADFGCGEPRSSVVADYDEQEVGDLTHCAQRHPALHTKSKVKARADSFPEKKSTSLSRGQQESSEHTQRLQKKTSLIIFGPHRLDLAHGSPLVWGAHNNGALSLVDTRASASTTAMQWSARDAPRARLKRPTALSRCWSDALLQHDAVSRAREGAHARARAP